MIEIDKTEWAKLALKSKKLHSEIEHSEIVHSEIAHSEIIFWKVLKYFWNFMFKPFGAQIFLTLHYKWIYSAMSKIYHMQRVKNTLPIAFMQVNLFLNICTQAWTNWPRVVPPLSQFFQPLCKCLKTHSHCIHATGNLW